MCPSGYTQPSLADATAGFGCGTGDGSANLMPDGLPISRALIIGNPDLEPETSVMAFQTIFKDKIAGEPLNKIPKQMANIGVN